ncbi:portal protein [Shewanella sp. Koi 1]
MSDETKGGKPKAYSHDYDPNSNLDILAQELERKLSDTIYQRGNIDVRMVEDLRNYHGQYDQVTLEAMTQNETAKVFIKLTRAKTNAGEAQLVDLLFPNDDKNWGIKPTPVPELVEMLEDKETPFELNGEQYQDEQGNVISNADVAARKQEKINAACDKMEKLISDQLVETKYNAKCREIIHDACVVGTGIIKGPVVLGKTDRAYTKDDDGNFVAEIKQSFEPGCEVVRPWDFYPDMSASTIEEAEFVFERRFMSKKQIRNLVNRKGFDKGRVAKVLQMTSTQTQHRSTYMDDVRILAGLSDSLNDTRYETWEYHGPVTRQVLEELKILEPIDPENEIDSQDEYDAVVFYCGGVVLGAKLALMDYSQDMPYRVYNWELDDSSIFGYGIPRMVRDEQAIINTTWRMILDNGAITSGPQIGVNKKHVKPQDGVWNLKPRKFWNIEGAAQDIKQAFTTFEFDSHINELSQIYQTARILFDEVSGVPMLQQGEQGQSTQTLGGMSMLMNAANTVRRNQVKQWDDFITSPLISDFYHFNMMHSDDNEVKGDYQVDARGTSALLIKEQVGQALTNFINIAGNNPIFAPVLQLKSVQILKQWIKTQSLPDDIIPTDEELAQYQKQMEEQQAQGQQDPSMQLEQMRMQQVQIKADMDMQLAQFNAQQRMAEKQAELQMKQQQIAADMQRQESQERIELMKLAQNDKLNTEKLMVELQKVQSRAALEWDKFMAESNMKLNQGLTANYGLE